jgi:hypothetical protein
VSTTGGAISTTSRPSLTQWAANNIAQVLSDGADTRTVTVTGRNTAGAIVTDAIVLNGATPVNGVVTFERVVKIVTTALAARTVSIKEAAAGTIRATIPPTPELETRILFYDSASGAGILIRCEKTFFKNNHGTLTLTNAAIKLTADPAARIRIGCAPTKGDSATTANRLATPASVTFVDDNVSQAIPTGALAAGETIGVWAELNLPANDPANKSTWTQELSGSTT